MLKILIITKNCGLDEYIDDNYTGFKVSPNDVDAYKEKILFLLNEDNRHIIEHNINNKMKNNIDYMTNEGFIKIVLKELDTL